MYLVLAMHENVIVGMSPSGTKHKVKLSYFDGMVGAMPVFATKEAAEKFAKGKAEIIELEDVQCED